MKIKMYKVKAKKRTISSLEKITMVFLTILSIVSSIAVTSLELCGDENVFGFILLKNLLLGVIGSALVSVVAVYVPYSAKKRTVVEKFYKDATGIFYTYINILNILLVTEDVFKAAQGNNLESDSSFSFDIIQFKKSVPEEVDKICSDIVRINNELDSLEFTSKEIKNIMDLINNSIFPGAKLIGKLYASMNTMVREDYYNSELYPSIICYFTRKIYDITNTKCPYQKVRTGFKKFTDLKTQNDFFAKNINSANSQLISSLESVQIDINTASAVSEFNSSVIEITGNLYKCDSEDVNDEDSYNLNEEEQNENKDE